MAQYLVLIVDDDELFRTSMKFNVEDMGHAVIEARDGAEALEMAKSRQPHLIVSDIEMPDMDGVELNTMLMMEEATKKIPVLMLTGNDYKKMQVAALFSKTMKYECMMWKHQSTKEILEKIQEILDHHYNK